MESLLKSDLGMTKGVTLLTDADATKENIINAIQSLKPVVSGRDEFILIFFSGIAARARTPDASDGQSTMGLICPVDAYETGGISDGALLQLLDQVAKERGRNICVFLDCSGGIFSWEIPQSCTIYAPSKADETAAGGAFTQAVLRTFREHKDKLDQMTHWALRGAIQTAMTKTTVYCWGEWANRPLFNSQGPDPHHSYIPCYQSGDGTIILSAGAAHGVRPGAIYGAYSSNQSHSDPKEVKKLATLVVKYLNNDEFTSVLQLQAPGPENVPSFFYAAEEQGYADPIKVFVDGQRPTVDPLTWVPAPQSRASITLKKVDTDVRIVWNGAGKLRRKAQESDSPYTNNEDTIRWVLSRAARFQSLVFAPGPSVPPIASWVTVQLLQEKSSKNLLGTHKFHAMDEYKEFKVGRNDVVGPCHLVLQNVSTVDLWPHVMICNPLDYTIEPWYLPPLGSYTPPLKANETLVVGRTKKEFETDDQPRTFGIFFEWQPNRNLDFLYIKVFLTREKTDYSSLTQWYISPLEDHIRGYKDDSRPPGQRNVERSRSPLKVIKEAPRLKSTTAQEAWASGLLTFVARYT